MAKKKTIKLPIAKVKKALDYLGLDHVDEEHPDGNLTQIWLTQEGFSHVNINAYATGAVVVQPYADQAADSIDRILTLRAARLRQKGKIPPSL